MELTNEAFARILLHGIPRVGAVTAWRWIRTLEGAQAVVSAKPDVLVALGAPADLAVEISGSEARARADAEVARARSHGIDFVFPLAEWDHGDIGESGLTVPNVECPPLVLTSLGRRELLLRERLAVAIVGTRTPTPYGAQQARLFAFDMAARGIAVVSGYARGIDREAHRAALDAGGDTIAVLGSGLLAPYPGDQPGLFQQIREKGLLISEFGLDSHASRSNFPRRNRILAGISNATLVIEAGGASGSLITARWAIDQGREVFVVPGRIDSPMSAGCHELLREGSWVASSISELMLDFETLFGVAAMASWGVRTDGPKRREPSKGSPHAESRNDGPGDPDPKSRLVERAGSGATLEELAQVWTGPPDDLFEAIVGLELAGSLERGPHGLLRAALARNRAVC